MERPRPDPEALLAHEAFLRRVARPLLRDDASVDDVVQETWLTALRKPPRDASKLRQWLGKVARSLALRARRAEERRTRREQAAARPEGDDVVARVARHQRIVDAVLGLDEPYRTAVLLRFYDGLTTDEIGARSGVTGAAVRKRLKKALDLLRARLDELHDGDRRAWSAVLLPFVILPRGKPAALLGGLVVGTKAKVGLSALLLLAVIGALWSVTRRSAPPARTEAARVVEHGSEPSTPAAVEGELLPPPVDFSRIDRDRDVHGVVVRHDGTPVAGAVVEAVYLPWTRVAHMDRERQFVERAGPRTRSARDGTFALRLEWGDLVHLRTSSDGFATSDAPLVQAGERVRVVLAPPVRLDVRVRDEAGAVVAGAQVRLVAADTLQGAGQQVDAPRWQREGVTGEGGDLSWSDLPDEGRASVYVVDRTHASMQRWVDLATEHEVAITLPAGMTITGRVLDAETLRPIAGAVVDTLGAGPKRTCTSQDGRYTLEGLKPTVLRFTAEGYADTGVQIGSSKRLSYREMWPERLVEDVDEIEVHLVKADVVVGRVVDHEGAPVTGAFLSVRSPALLRGSAETGSDGRFRFEGPWSAPARPAAGVPEGWHSLAVFARGHGRVRVPFDAEHLDLGDIVLPPPGTIEGRVLTPAGDPVPGAPVFLHHNLMSESRRTDDLGRFRFKDLEPGAFSLGTEPEGAPNLWQQGDLPEGGRVVVDLQYESWRQLTVRVRTEDGTPVAGARAMVSTGFRMSQAVTGADGLVTLNVGGKPKYVNLTPPALDGDFAYARPSPIRLEGDEQEVTFVLVRMGLVRGRVETPEGTALGMAQIVAQQGDRQVGSIGTRPDGTFEMQVPVAATFDLVLTGTSYEFGTPSEPLRILRGRLAGVRTGARDVVVRAHAVEALGTLRVRVLTPDGDAAAAQVIATPSAWPFFVETKNGVAELRGLPDEEVQVSTGRPPVWSWLRPNVVQVVPAGQEVTLRFREAATIAGKVLLPDGSPAVEAQVLAYFGKDEVALCRADAQGVYGLAVEPDTKGPLRVEARLYADQEYEATLDGIQPGASGVEIRLAAVR